MSFIKAISVRQFFVCGIRCMMYVGFSGRGWSWAWNNDKFIEVAELKALVYKLANGGNANADLSRASLGDATPNPVKGSILISYNVPQEGKNAYLLLTDMNGSTVKQVLPNSRGAGKVTLNTAAFAAGTYSYSLFVDGGKVASKQLLIAR